MTTHEAPPPLTPAAKRDLDAIRRGERPDLRFGPYEQLVAHGYIDGPQDAYRVIPGVAW
jgi:hypothetical protein